MSMPTSERPPASVHLLNCGQGNMTLVVAPDDTVLLYDCRVTQDDEQRLLSYLGRYIPRRKNSNGKSEQWIDWFICSHRDEDHVLGLKAVNTHFAIRGIFDTGTTSGATTSDANLYYMRLKQRLANADSSRVVVPIPSTTSPMLDLGGLEVWCLCSGKDDQRSDDGHYGNNVLLMEYAGNRVMLTGDSDWLAWKEKIVPQFMNSGRLSADVLIASHHGSRSFFVTSEETDPHDWAPAYTRHLELISPTVTLVSSGEQTEKGHPNPIARRNYKKFTWHKQVYLTRDKGDFVVSLDKGGYNVTPSRFLEGYRYRRISAGTAKVTISCVATPRHGLPKSISSGARLPVSDNYILSFSASTSGGMVTGNDKVSVHFEVSNAGRNEDSTHHEIYDKGTSESGARHQFERELSYVGQHLLRCQVYNHRTKRKVQGIFVVSGY